MNLLRNFVIFLLIPASGFLFQQCNSPKVEYYGEKITEDGAHSVAHVPHLLEGNKEKQVKLEGKITSCCQKKGCWMKVDIGNGETMHVTFKDYGFFVPLDAAESEVIMEGVLKQEEIDVETLKHYAEDAGKSQEEIDQITEPSIEYTYEASGIILKRPS